MNLFIVIIASASLVTIPASSEPLKAFEHKLVDICGVRDLLEANCNGATDIDACDRCVHELVKSACPATEPADCIALVTVSSGTKSNETLGQTYARFTEISNNLIR